MIKDVKVLVRTNINYHNSTNELIEYQYNGTQYLKKNNIFLRYKDNNNQDMGNTWTIVKWNEDENPTRVTLIRQGETRSKNVFQKGYKHIGEYYSLSLLFEMETTTKDLYIKKKANGGQILVNYNLKLNNQLIGNYIFEIDYIFDK